MTESHGFLGFPCGIGGVIWRDLGRIVHWCAVEPSLTGHLRWLGLEAMLSLWFDSLLV